MKVLARGDDTPTSGGARTPYPGADKEPAKGLSRKDKALLLLEQVGNKRFRRLFTSLYRRTGDVRRPPLMERIKTRIEHEVDTRSVRLAAVLLRRTKGRIARLWRRQVLLLTTRGRKSGKERTVPLQFFPDGDDMIVLAANSGLPSPPGWYFNLTADPLVQVEVGDRTLQVRAEELSSEEAAAFWPRVLQVAPEYAKYPRRTSRRIPMIRLALAAPAGSVPASRSPSGESGGLP